MTARAIDEAHELLRRRRRRAVEAALLAVVCGVLAAIAWGWSFRLGLALGIGAGVEAAIAVWSFLARRELVEELAIEPAAHAIPDVREYARRLAAPRARRLTADSIRSMVAKAFRPDSRFTCYFLVDRVAVYRRELEGLARDLATPGTRVEPVAAARARWLLTHAADNPLFDRRVPEEDLGSLLVRIRAGIQRPDVTGR